MLTHTFMDCITYTCYEFSTTSIFALNQFWVGLRKAEERRLRTCRTVLYGLTPSFACTWPSISASSAPTVAGRPPLRPRRTYHAAAGLVCTWAPPRGCESWRLDSLACVNNSRENWTRGDLYLYFRGAGRLHWRRTPLSHFEAYGLFAHF